VVARDPRLLRVGRRERDAPEVLGFVVLLEKLDGVGRNAVKRRQLRDYARGHQGATLILHHHRGAHQQFALQLDSGSVPVQAGSLGGHQVEGAPHPILPRKRDGRMQGHAAAASFQRLAAASGRRDSTGCRREDWVRSMRFRRALWGIEVHS
jgi:hypothetical protein